VLDEVVSLLLSHAGTHVAHQVLSRILETDTFEVLDVEPSLVDRAIDQFEQIYADSRDSARVMALVVHPYIMGAPHRAKYYRRALEDIRKRKDVLFWTGEEILDWYLEEAK
jgi:hypothetical protein